MKKWARVVLALVAPCMDGCYYTARAQGGLAWRPAGVDGDVGGSVGVGVFERGTSGALLVGAQGGPRGILVLNGYEYSHNLGSVERPWGLRVRGEWGYLAEAGGAVTGGRGPSGLFFGLVPGVWWAPYRPAHGARRLVLGLELRGGVRLAAEEDPARGLLGVNLVAQWDWILGFEGMR